MSTSNDPQIGPNIAGKPINRSTFQELGLNVEIPAINNRLSNIGGDNLAKTKFPLPRTLFYDGALLDPGVKQAEKYGLFMFYSFGGGEGSNYLDQYYLSERQTYNRRISSADSKNPTAGQLVKDTAQYSSLISGGSNSTVASSNPIIGETSAPYYWKDFIYCKYYGTIPNNRLVTLRRFASPVLDNFSLPKGITDPAHQKKGIGVPVAQAVTWFGGKSGNTLNDIISFSTGINWTTAQTDREKVQTLFGDSLLNSEILKKLINLASTFSGSGSAASDISDTIKDQVKTQALDGIATAQSPVGDDLTASRFYKAFRDQVKSDPDRFGILSERIWVPVDIIENTKVRDVGLSFTWNTISLKFTYDITSAGEVNSKAALFDILSNLLAISTNYGNFITPDVRYDSEYSAITFPGGEESAKNFYTALETFLLNTKNLFIGEDANNVTTVGGAPVDETVLQQYEKALLALETAIRSGGGTSSIDSTLISTAVKAVQSVLGQDAAAQWQAPVSLYSGAPIGEWHLVVGNPYNPIAMIGNLVCTGCDISFGESLGPDDFPTTIEATITLDHGRDRERGEIESIFNRGDGRLYQSVKSTAANAQTFNTLFDLNGNIFDGKIDHQFFNPDTGLPGSQGDVFQGQQLDIEGD